VSVKCSGVNVKRLMYSDPFCDIAMCSRAPNLSSYIQTDRQTDANDAEMIIIIANYSILLQDGSYETQRCFFVILCHFALLFISGCVQLFVLLSSVSNFHFAEVMVIQ